MLLQRGSKEKDLVSALKERLSKLGYEISDIGGSKGVFGPKVEAAVKDFQKRSGLLADGKVGTMTEMALAAALTSPVKVPKPEVVKPESKGDMPSGWLRCLAVWGWTEFNHDKEIAKDWKWAGLPQYKSVIGKKNAWCGLACEIALRSGGLRVQTDRRRRLLGVTLEKSVNRSAGLLLRSSILGRSSYRSVSVLDRREETNSRDPGR